ncbi:hypothetical protein CROQUDRAFT_129935 [Cronartium quercuum f. sp. fusiforme G11]|uniref:Uncharacterized protein n=1 Tax=Cronartium quercuum f. sp. fusiforme G11 TaxID=708437 RepID=A0A9P6NQH6_9BASI|nr:hypothetical protein CROQUDRAFT_129935 [Cronartium quercuum f. sp. fusiforme G11]
MIVSEKQGKDIILVHPKASWTIPNTYGREKIQELTFPPLDYWVQQSNLNIFPYLNGYSHLTGSGYAWMERFTRIVILRINCPSKMMTMLNKNSLPINIIKFISEVRCQIKFPKSLHRSKPPSIVETNSTKSNSFELEKNRGRWTWSWSWTDIFSWV